MVHARPEVALRRETFIECGDAVVAVERGVAGWVAVLAAGDWDLGHLDEVLGARVVGVAFSWAVTRPAAAKGGERGGGGRGPSASECRSSVRLRGGWMGMVRTGFPVAARIALATAGAMRECQARPRLGGTLRFR
ncbi:MAG: hypothetical protein R3B70_43365 [Polyangiaceae bacterium]